MPDMYCAMHKMYTQIQNYTKYQGRNFEITPTDDMRQALNDGNAEMIKCYVTRKI